MTATLSRRQLKIAQRQRARDTAPGRDLIATYTAGLHPIPSYGATPQEVITFRRALNDTRAVVKSCALKILSPVHPSGLSRVGRRRAKAQARKAVAQ
jgi:hypothetical protein